MSPTPAAHIRAALNFYAQVDAHLPGSELAEIAEHAAAMALARPRSTSSSSLQYDIWRNARFVVRRSQRRRRLAHNRLKSDAEAQNVIAASGGQIPPTPEDVYTAVELEERIRAAAGDLHPLGIRALEGLIVGESETDAAASMGVHVRTVRRIRRSIRAATGQLLDQSRN